MAEKLLVPVYLPRWLHGPIRSVKRAVIPAAPEVRYVDIVGERNIEWSFLSAEMPHGPGEAIEFGCEQGYLSLLAAQRGFNVTANDLQSQHFTWQHPSVRFLLGDLLQLELPDSHFDLAINCSSVEHVGVVGRYGIAVEQDEGDLRVMNRLARILKQSGVLLMTVPCGRDAVLDSWCRVYGSERLPRLLNDFTVSKEEFWIKSEANQWVQCGKNEAMSFEPKTHASDGHACSYALGCFVLGKNL